MQQLTSAGINWCEPPQILGRGKYVDINILMSTEMGLKVARLLLDDEVNQRCGLRYERVPERQVTRYGRQRGVVVIAGQKLPVERLFLGAVKPVANDPKWTPRAELNLGN